jgi:hypothetical protein
MSLRTGYPQLQGIGASQANSAFDQLVAAADSHARRFIESLFPGQALAGVYFDSFVAPYNLYIESVQFSAQFGKPTGADLIARFKLDSTEDTTDFTLADGVAAAEDSAATPIFVAAGQTVAWKFHQVGSTEPGNFVQLRIKICPTEAAS